MVKIKKKIVVGIAAVLAVLLLLSAIFVILINPGSKGYFPKEKSLTDNKPEQGDYKLTFSEETGRFQISNAKTGVSWESNPENWKDDETAKDIWRGALTSQLLVRYMTNDGTVDKTVSSYTASTKKGKTKFEATETGYRAVYTFEQEGFVIPLDVMLDENNLVATVDVQKIQNKGQYKIVSLSVLPFFGAGSMQDKGYMLMPSGSGAVINFNNGKNSAGELTVKMYGSDLSVSPDIYTPEDEPGRMPVFGVSRNKNSFVAVIEDGDALAEVTASVSGCFTNYNNIYPRFNLCSTDTFYLKDFTNQDREFAVLSGFAKNQKRLRVRYLLIDNKDSYSDMGSACHEYFKQKYSLQDGKKSSQVYIDLNGAVMKEALYLGMVTEKPYILSDFASVNNMLDELNRNNIKDITLNMRNYTENTVYKKRLENMNLISGFGDERLLTKAQSKLGKGRLFLGVDPAKAGSRGIFNSSSGLAAKTIMNLTAYFPTYNLETKQKITEGSSYALAAPYIGSGIMKIASQRQKYPVFFDTVGDTIYSDFGKLSLSRQDCADIISDALKNYHNNKGTVMTSGGNAYAAFHSDDIESLPSDSGKAVLIDYGVPFLQLVLGDTINYSGKAINLSDNPQYEFLKSIESGSSIHFSFILSKGSTIKNTDLSGLYGAEYAVWKNDVILYSKKAREISTAANGTSISGHKIIEDKVTQTVFSNGAELIINYRGTPYTYNGRTIAPMDYIVLSGGE